MPEAVVLFTGVVVFAQMYGLGTRQSPGTFRRLFAQPALVFRALFSVLVVVPLVAFLLVLALPLPIYVAVGLAILASSPGAPLTTRRSEAAAADFEFVSALQLLLAMAAIVFTPISLSIFAHALEKGAASTSPLTVAVQVGTVTFLPASLGWLSALAAPRLRQRHNRIVAIASRSLYLLFLLVLLLALALVPDLRGSLAIGWLGALAIVALCVAALAGGYVLGGPRRNTRAGLAIASVARNIGLAIYIAEQSDATLTAIPTILLFAVVGVCLALPASIVMKKQTAE